MRQNRPCRLLRPLPIMAGMVWPNALWACALPPSIILTLPTGHYILAAALVVALTAVLALSQAWLPQFNRHTCAQGRVFWPPAMLSYGSFFILLGLIAIGFLGSRDPMHNLMTLVFWAGVWVGVPLVSLLCGNLWAVINPWSGPVRLARFLLGRRGSIGLSRLATWPAVIGFAGFSWFQLISLYPDDPAVLARLAALYWAIIFILAVAEGEDWLRKGECFSVLFAMISRVSPIWGQVSGDRWYLRSGWPGTQLLHMPALGRSGVVFVTLVLAALSFDGLSDTFWWQGLIGVNPLEPMGRSDVMWVNSFGLIGLWAIGGGVIWGAWRLSDQIAGVKTRLGPVMLSFLAIAAGYHSAHYLLTFLGAGQYALAALNDPFLQGDSYLGLPNFYVSFGYLSDPTVMPMLYGAQFVAIVLAHVLAVVVAVKLSPQGVGVASHLPMTVLMIGFTVFGLWMLSTARSG